MGRNRKEQGEDCPTTTNGGQKEQKRKSHQARGRRPLLFCAGLLLPLSTVCTVAHAAACSGSSSSSYPSSPKEIFLPPPLVLLFMNPLCKPQCMQQDHALWVMVPSFICGMLSLEEEKWFMVMQVGESYGLC